MDNHKNYMSMSRDNMRSINPSEGGRLRERAEDIPGMVTSPESQHGAMSKYFVDVLVVEDNQSNQLVFSHILKSMGASFKVAANGKQAIEQMIKHRPAIILMDVSMPIMDGLEATRSIRGLTRDTDSFFGYRPYILAITANYMEQDKLECLDAGMDGFMAKPISPKMLRTRLRKVMVVMDIWTEQHTIAV
jgi:CheY-like chemotaxis protein